MVDTVLAVPQPPLPPTTTEQEDRVSRGQRRINLIWEVTQSIISVSVVLSNMFVAIHSGLASPADRAEHPVVLSSALFLIIGFYFSRTNHSATGGIGSRKESEYTGR